MDPALVTLAGATAADRALAHRRYADALDGYRAELVDAPDRPSSWIGFALAWSSLAPGPGPTLLLRQPQLGTPATLDGGLAGAGGVLQPDTLATWLAERLPAGDEVHERPRTGMA
ncbi:hypothetical protein SALBM311S_05979 [Streptomyces alboniger]